MSWLSGLFRRPEAQALPADLTGEQLLGLVRALPVTSFREGYDQDEVDAFAARVAAAFDRRGEPLAPADVLNQRFQATKFRQGYDQDAVDDLLDRVVVTLRARC